jgi:hypothetical protein
MFQLSAKFVCILKILLDARSESLRNSRLKHAMGGSTCMAAVYTVALPFAKSESGRQWQDNFLADAYKVRAYKGGPGE